MANAHAPAHGHHETHVHKAHSLDALPPPHAGHHDDHGHGAPDNGKVVAVIVILAMVFFAAKTGLVVPPIARQRSTESTRMPTSGRGIVVLQDGRVFRGPIQADASTVRVDDQADGGQVVVDRAAVRWFNTESDALPGKQAGLAPAAGEGGGIVVLKSGQVFVGRVSSDGGAITVRWPYGENTFQGEVVVPRDKVRFFDPAHDRLGDDYWREHAADPIDPAYRREARDDRRSDATPAGSGSPRTRAELAQTRGDWERATAAWAEVYGASHEAADLTNLHRCAGEFLRASLEREDPDRAFTTLRELLTPFASVPLIRQDLGDLYVAAANFKLVTRRLKDAEGWVAAMRALGGEWNDAADKVARAIEGIRAEAEKEEAEEHEAHEDGRRPG